MAKGTRENRRLILLNKGRKLFLLKEVIKGNWLKTAWKRDEERQEECSIITGSCEWDGGEDHCIPIAK